MAENRNETSTKILIHTKGRKDMQNQTKLFS